MASYNNKQSKPLMVKKTKITKQLYKKMIITPVFWGVVIILIVSLFGQFLLPYDPIQPNLLRRLEPPSSEHWFGTDPMGMDVFSRVIAATRTDFSIAISAVIIGMLIGVPLGAVSGYFGGFIDDILTRIVEVIQSFPMFLFAMAVFIMLGAAGHYILIGIIAFYNIPIFLKLVRSVVLPLRNSEFVLAARCAGNSKTSIIFRHILPNSLGPVVSQFSICCAYAIQIVAALSFIGLGIEPPYPEWGSMIMTGAPHIINGVWWPSIFPGLAIFLSVLVMHNLGNRLMRLYQREV